MNTIQTGPIYRCWVCGKPARGILDFQLMMGGPTLLDKYADYIGYLDLDPECRRAKHPSRIARLGNLITPLHFPEGCSLEERIQAIQQAVNMLIVHKGPYGYEDHKTLQGRIARIVYQVHIGTIPPDEAIQTIIDLVEVQHEVSMVW